VLIHPYWGDMRRFYAHINELATIQKKPEWEEKRYLIKYLLTIK